MSSSLSGGDLEIDSSCSREPQVKPRSSYLMDLKLELPQKSSRRVEEYDANLNEDDHRFDLHLIDEKREATMIHAENYQQQAKAYHDKRVPPRHFQVGDYDLRRRVESKPQEGGKFAKRWEVLYAVTTVV
nr:uncharacterized protein LOC109177136 [Ipomoea trifida]